MSHFPLNSPLSFRTIQRVPRGGVALHLTVLFPREPSVRSICLIRVGFEGMKAIIINRQFQKGPLIADALRRVLERDKTATPSWSPDGKRVVITFDSRTTLSLLCSWFAGLRILDVDLPENGNVTVHCASPGPALFTKASDMAFTQNFLRLLEREIEEPQHGSGG
jgi:hypothetical protein